MRRFVIAGGLAAIISGCVAATPSTPPDDAVVAEITADALARGCATECNRLRIYVRDELVSSPPQDPAETQPMPDATTEAIRSAFEEVTFVDGDGAMSLFGEDFLVDGGRGVLVEAGPLRHLTGDVYGIDVGVHSARDGAHGGTLLYTWNGSTWMRTTAEDADVTVTSWVS